MVNIKRFFDRVSAMDAKPGRDLVIPSIEARALRDEIAKLLADKVESSNQTEVTEIRVSGGTW